MSVTVLVLTLILAGCTSDGSGVDEPRPSATFQTVQEPAEIAATCQAEFRGVFKDNFGDPQFADAPEVRRQAESATVTGSVRLTPVDASAGPADYSYTCTMVPNTSVAPSGWAIPTLQLKNRATGVMRNIHQDYLAPSPAAS